MASYRLATMYGVCGDRWGARWLRILDLRGVVTVVWVQDHLDLWGGRDQPAGRQTGHISFVVHPEPMQCPRWTVLGALESVGPAGAAHPISAAKTSPVEQELTAEHALNLSGFSPLFGEKPDKFSASRSPWATP